VSPSSVLQNIGRTMHLKDLARLGNVVLFGRSFAELRCYSALL